MEKKNIGLIVLVIILSILVVGLGTIVIYDKVLSKENSNTEINNNDENNSNSNIDEQEKEDSEEYENQNEITKETQITNITVDKTSLGNIIVTKNGDVYYNPVEKVWFSQSHQYPLTFENETVLGSKETHILDEYVDMEGKKIEFQGYKLDLSNIQGAYPFYFGNGDGSGSIIFIGYDGYISELTIRFGTENSKIEFTKNIQKYKNIISAVPMSGNYGHYAILIDKDGNKYNYYGAEFE